MGKNTAKSRPSRPPVAAPAPPANRNRTVLWAAIGVLAAAALVAAIVSVGGDDDNGSASEGTVITSPDGSGGGASSPAELQPVTIVGDPLPALQSGEPDEAVGLTAPTLEGFGFDGQPITIEPGSGGPMLVVVFAHWCPHCNNELPVLAQWRDEGMVPEGLQVVGISTAAEENAPNFPPSEWVVEMDWTWPVLVDDAAQDAALAYGVSGYPFFAVLDEDGTVQTRGSGEMSLEAFDQLVRSALES
jgi:cytochrome c biogenesis protein CcmG, thiol:disulfide interchange protein DsbE